MKNLVLACGLLLTTSSFAATLHNYNDISAALMEGKSIRFVIDFAQCTFSDKRAAKIMTMAVFTPNEIGITNEHIATSMTHFTVNDPFFPGKPVQEFARYTLTSDNNMKISLQVFDAATYALLKDKIYFDCKIDEAAKVYA